MVCKFKAYPFFVKPKNDSPDFSVCRFHLGFLKDIQRVFATIFVCLVLYSPSKGTGGILAGTMEQESNFLLDPFRFLVSPW